jgi:hypothetical protein
MPSPVVLEVTLAPGGTAPNAGVTPAAAGANARVVDANTVVYTWPVDVWFDGRRTFDAVIDVGGRQVTRVRLDPGGRFPDRDPGDNAWPR